MPLWGPTVKCPCSPVPPVCDFCWGQGCAIWRLLIVNDKKWLHDLLLNKFCFIVQQRTFYQLQFWRRRINVLYSTTYIHISVKSTVELISRDTALIHNHKSTLSASALKPYWFNSRAGLMSAPSKKPVKQCLITELSYVLCLYCQNTQGWCID